MILEVESSTPDTWHRLNGINSFSLNPAEGEEFADVTKFSDQGNPRRRKMQRGDSITAEGELLRDPDTGALDPGQKRVIEVNKLVGNSGLLRIRYRHPLDTTWEVWTSTVSMGEQGGGTNEMLSFSATFARDGAASSAAVV